MGKPVFTEYESEYMKYYIDLVQGDDAVKALDSQMHSSLKFLKLLNEDQGNYRYAEGKWSLKDVLGHIMDTERIFSYRALCFSRGETKALPGYEQDDYVANADFNSRSMAEMINEYKTMRESNLSLFKSFTPEQLARAGSANGKKVSVRALIFMLAGHEIHHMNVIRTKYLT